MLIFDAHLDLSMNALEWNRDLTRPIFEIRQREKGLTDKQDRGKGTVSFSEMRRGGIGLCVATQIARYVKPANRLAGWHSPAQAWAHTQGQLAWYRAMQEAGELVQITNGQELDAHLRLWQNWLESRQPLHEGNAETKPVVPHDTGPPLGYILSLEGADSLVTLRYLES